MNYSLSANKSTMSLHDELLTVLPAIQQRRSKLDFIKKTPDIFIDQVHKHCDGFLISYSKYTQIILFKLFN
jgi:hypothetical protein